MLMDEREKKIVKKYISEDGRFSEEDHDRLARKAVKQAFGNATYSEASATAALYIVPIFQSQEKADRARSGSHRKRVPIIWDATVQIIKDKIDATAREVWESLPQFEDLEWTIEIETEVNPKTGADEQVLHVKHHSKARERAGRKTVWRLRYDSFRTGYVTKIRKQIRNGEE